MKGEMRMKKIELIAGKRYMWPSSNAYGARMVNGLFTGEYNDNNNAVFVARNGERWSVPVEVIAPMPKKGM